MFIFEFCAKHKTSHYGGKMLIAFLIMVFVFGIIAAVFGIVGGILILAFKLVFWLIPVLFAGAIVLGIPALIILAIIKLLR